MAPGATLVARWSDQETTPLVAVKGRVVAMNAYPFSTDSGIGGWNSTDENGARLLANLLLFKGVLQPRNNVAFWGHSTTHFPRQ